MIIIAVFWLGLKKYELHFWFYLGAIFILFHMFTPVKASLSIKNNKADLNYLIITNNDTIKTDDNIHYIDKTVDYTFVYYVRDKRTRILKNENIKEVKVFPKKKKVKIKEKVEKPVPRQLSPIMTKQP